MKMMKLAFVAVLAVTSLASTQAMAYQSKYECGVKLYDGLTKAGTKRLVLCSTQGGISYNFGPVNGKPELDVLIPTSNALSYANRYPSLALTNGAYTYEVSDDSILVSKSGKSLATVKMREPTVSELGYSLAEYGIQEAN